MQAMRQIAEDQMAEEQEKERLSVLCPKCDMKNKNWVQPFSANECSECGAKYLHAEALAHQEHEDYSKQKKAMDMLEDQETEYWKKKAREN